GRKIQVCAMEYSFIGGSMGSVVGEKIARAIERAIEQRTPLVIVSASGGARMQEGAVSLMQMAKISAALMRLDEARVPYISVLTDPTTGGETAKLGLDRIRSVLGALGSPQDRCRIVHVAGTNGKGSTCAMIESALRAGGRRTGLFTSPHLAEPTERIRINGEPISAERFTQA